MRKSVEMIQQLEYNFKNKVINNLSLLKTLASPELIRFFTFLQIQKVQGDFVKFQIPVEYGEIQAAFTSVEMHVLSDGITYSIGIYEYYDSSNQTFQHTDFLINAEWKNGTEVVGERFSNVFGFSQNAEPVIQWFLNEMNLHKNLKVIEETIFSEENGEMAI